MERFAQFMAAADQFRARAAGRTIWNVSSTATGGGVAEMLQGLVGYVRDLDIDIQWVVIGADAEFFAVTKRLHNQLHGATAGGALGGAAAAHYEQVLAGNAKVLLDWIRPGDLVLLHDPQTAGLAPTLVRHGGYVVWRCHIGVDRQTDVTLSAWEFLRPYLSAAQGYVFSRRQYPPPWLPPEMTWMIPPSIDPFSPKNQELNPGTVRAIMGTVGLVDGFPPHGVGRFVQRDGTVGEVRRSATVVADELPSAADPVVTQVSRWDRLKDMSGVMAAFAEYVVPEAPGWLVLAGPEVNDVGDDPEGAAVYAECLAVWRALPPARRRRILLATLPLDDVDENGAMVNALQRHATVVVQKSLAEGFGLTVAEAMWKARPVIGSAVGGIQDQIADGTGILLDDPTDLPAFGAALGGLLRDPDRAQRLGAAAQAFTHRHFVADLHLLRYAELFETLLDDR